MTTWRLGRGKFPVTACAVLLLVAVVSACGPDLSEPAPLNINGHWLSYNEIGPISGVQLDIAQALDGTLTGRWSAVTSSPGVPCPPNLSSTPSGPISGGNTVLQVQISLIGIGDFTGQWTSDTTVNGSLISCGQVYRMLFTLQESAL